MDFDHRYFMTNARTTSTDDAVISEIHIAAPPDRVYAALTDPTQQNIWWDNETCPLDHLHMDARRGGQWGFTTKKTQLNVNGVDTFVSHGEILEMDPPRLLIYTWVANWHDDRSRITTVRWDLKPQSGGTLVRVTHSGLSQEDVARKDYTGGWPGVLDQLRNYIEQS